MASMFIVLNHLYTNYWMSDVYIAVSCNTGNALMMFDFNLKKSTSSWPRATYMISMYVQSPYHHNSLVNLLFI